MTATTTHQKGRRATQAERDLIRYASAMSSLFARVIQQVQQEAKGANVSMSDELERLGYLALVARFVEMPPETDQMVENICSWTAGIDTSIEIQGRRYALRDVRDGRLREALAFLGEEDEMTARVRAQVAGVGDEGEAS